MSNAIRISPPIKPLQRKKYNYFLPEVSSFLQNLSVSSRETASLVKHSLVCSTKTHTVTDQIAKLTALTRDDPLQDHDPPVSVELEPVSNESQFDRVIAEAQQFEESVIVIWMASWCRKCIYLKPKLERLAAEYYPRIRFYCVDVNAVPHKLVARAGVTVCSFSLVFFYVVVSTFFLVRH